MLSRETTLKNQHRIWTHHVSHDYNMDAGGGLVLVLLLTNICGYIMIDVWLDIRFLEWTRSTGSFLHIQMRISERCQLYKVLTTLQNLTLICNSSKT